MDTISSAVPCLVTLSALSFLHIGLPDRPRELPRQNLVHVFDQLIESGLGIRTFESPMILHRSAFMQN